MHRSSLLARVLTIVIAVIVTPIAAGLLSAGGNVWLLSYFRYADSGFDFGRFAIPVAIQALALLLLAGVVLTGIWSSAGLIAVGILALLPILYALFPALLLGTYQGLGQVIPREWIDGVTYGIPLVLYPVMGMMGVVLTVVRRRPSPTGTGAAAVGLIVTPVLLSAGALLLAWGLGRGQMAALQNFRFDFIPLAAGAVVLGLVLVLAGISLTRWSAFALVLPAAALLIAGLLIVFPPTSRLLYSALPLELTRAVPALMLIGAGTAVAVIYLTFTATLLRVRARARAMPPADQPHSSAAQPYPPAPNVTTYPPAPPPYPPAS